MTNPNSFKYFDPDHGMTFNNKCPNCGTDTFAPERIGTCYEGQQYITNKPNTHTGVNEVVGVLRGVIDTKIPKDKQGIWCYQCDRKEFPRRNS